MHVHVHVHVQRETQRIRRWTTSNNVVQSAHIPTVAYELIDGRPMPQPAAYRSCSPNPYLLIHLFCVDQQHSDGFVAMEGHDEGRSAERNATNAHSLLALGRARALEPVLRK